MGKISLSEKSQEYFNKMQTEIVKRFDPDKKYIYNLQKDHMDNNTIELYDENKNFVLKAEYELIGIHNIFNSVWYWGWNIHLVDSALTKKSKNIKHISKDIKNNYSNYDPKEADEYYYITKNGNFYTSSDNIMKLVKLAMFINKGLWYIPICHGKDNTTCTKINKNKDKDLSIKRVEYLMITKIIWT